MNKIILIFANIFVMLLIILSSFFIYKNLSSNHNATDSVESTISGDVYAYLTTANLEKLEPLKATSKIIPTGEIKEFKLEAKIVDWEIMPGVVVKAVAYNGSVPGPTLEVTEGDLVRVTLKNNLDEDTSIHWHGLHLPNKEDGVPEITQSPIKPGETYTYEFLAGHAGTYMYHPHINSVSQIDRGLYAPFIIHPQDKEAQPKFDKEYTFIFGGWNVPQVNIDRSKMIASMGSAKEHSQEHEMVKEIEIEVDEDVEVDVDEHTGMDMGTDSEMNMGAMDYNFWTINGKAFPFTPEITVNKGERIRVRLINISNANHPMHLHGTDFRIIAEDSHPLKEPKIVNTIDVAPGKTYDIEFLADNQGNWIFHCHELHHTENDGVEPGGLISLIKYDSNEKLNSSSSKMQKEQSTKSNGDHNQNTH